MQNVNQPAFKPAPAGTVNIAAGTSTGNVQVQTGGEARHVRVFNSGAVIVFVEFGQSGVTASTSTSAPVAPGSVEIFSSPYPYAAAITASSTATVYFTPGEGI
jgi:hypothetical protein